MPLTGDPEGIDVLKAIKADRPEFLKFLLGEAKTNTTHSADFKAEDGTAYVLKFVPTTGDLVVEKK
jgi:hypothetical protein